jgi:tetratricopeptide (TPR) repeat protein
LADYNEDFYQYQMQGSLRSAEVIVPMVLDLVAVNSVIDIGCGVGTWLSVYRKHGVAEMQGVDGDYVDRNLLMIDAGDFRAHDLSAPFVSAKRYDLVQSLEVAEHIDPDHAQRFVTGLTALGDAILFSAAVPCQLGVGHVNEQYVDYWIELFSGQDYVPVDAFRPAVWNHEDVEICYRQNLLLFVHSSSIAGNQKLMDAQAHTRREQLSLIHPELYQARIQRLLHTLIDVARTVTSNGNFPLAQNILKSVVDFDPRNAPAWNVFGQLAAHAGDKDVAIAHFMRAVKINGTEAAYHVNLGQLLAAAGRPAEALEQLRIALAARPGDTAIQQLISGLETSLSG